MRTKLMLKRNGIWDIIDNIFMLIFVFFFTSLLYCYITPYFIEYKNNIAPSGDPFSYTIAWIDHLNVAHADFRGNLFHYKFKSWYLLFTTLISLLAPIISKPTPDCLAIINFFYFSIATFTIYRLSYQVIKSHRLALGIAFFYWFMPYHYYLPDDQVHPLSLFNLMLDNLFFNSSFVGIMALIIWIINPEKLSYAVAAGIFLGLSVWSRGNSIVYIAFLICFPLLYLIYNDLLKKYQKKALKTLLVFLLIFFLFTFYYYFTFGEIVKGYYLPHSKLVSRGIEQIIYYENFIKYPGIFFSNINYSLISKCSHLFILSTFIINLFCVKDKKISLIISTGNFIYIGMIFLFNGLFAHQEFSTIVQQFSPILIGLNLCMIGIILFVVQKYFKLLDKISTYLLVTIMIVSFLGGIAYTKYFFQQINFVEKKFSARKIENFAINFDKNFKKSKVAFLIYENYNPFIVIYYRLLNQMPRIYPDSNALIYSNLDCTNLFMQSSSLDYDLKKIQQCFIKVRDESNYIIMPEFSNFYERNLNGTYVMYYYFNQFKDVFNGKNAPKYIVKMVLPSFFDDRFVVLEKVKPDSKLLLKYDEFDFPNAPKSKDEVRIYKNAITSYL